MAYHSWGTSDRVAPSAPRSRSSRVVRAGQQRGRRAARGASAQARAGQQVRAGQPACGRWHQPACRPGQVSRPPGGAAAAASMVAANCEALYYPDRRWYPATKVGAPAAGSQPVMFIGFEGDGPQDTQSADIRGLGGPRGGRRPAAGGASRRCIELNRMLMGADRAQIHQLARDSAAEFNAVNCVTALQRLAKAGEDGGGAGGAVLAALCGHAAGLLRPGEAAPSGPEWQPRQLSTAMWGLGRLRQNGVPAPALQPLALALTGATVRALAGGQPGGSFQPQEISNCVWACGRLGRRDTALLAALSSAAIPMIGAFSPQGLSNVAWGFGTLGVAQPDLMDSVASAVEASVGRFNAQELSNTLFSFGKLQPQLREERGARNAGCRVLHAIAAVLPRFLKGGAAGRGGLSPQHLANLSWGCARILLHSDGAPGVEFGALFCEPIVRHAASCNKHELTMLVNSCVNARAATAVGTEAATEPIAGAMHAVGKAVVSMLESDNSALGPGQLATVAYGFARLELPALLVVSAMGRAAKSQLESFSWHDLSLLVWALARLKCHRPKLLAKVGRSVCRRLRALKAAGASSASGVALGHEAGLVSAGCLLPIDDGPQLASSDDTAAEETDDVAPRHLATLMWSFATLGEKNDKLAAAIARAARRNLALFSPRDLANTAWGYATLGIAAPRLLPQLAQAGADRLGEFSAQECSQFLWACEKAGLLKGGQQKHGDDNAVENLAIASQRRRLRSFELPDLPENMLAGNGDGDAGSSTVSIEWQPAGRGLSHTGTAPWDAAYVLADWLCRHQCPAAIPALQAMLVPPGVASLVEGDADATATWQQWGGRQGVELGAGVGLLSIAAARLGVSMVTTDGDDQVIALLRDNISRQKFKTAASGAMPVRVHKFLWGQDTSPLGLTGAAGLILATGVVYGDGGADGDDEVGWSGLVESLLELSDERSLILLCHGQGAAPGVHKGQGPFFDRLGEHFDCATMPSQSLRSDFRRSSVIHALRRRAPGQSVAVCTSTAASATNQPKSKKRLLQASSKGGKAKRHK